MRGFTLVELIVVLVLLGLLATGGVMAVASGAARTSDATAWSLLRARVRAARLGTPETVTVAGHARQVVFPDGRVFTDSDGDGGALAPSR